ncbi:MAG TPA: DUF2203 domain-containing protein [Candidatus Limnocylindria bacterium]|nr:DUF2203 domain-containing protein [Candidatus Limnocylindria bacterium]
MKQRRIYTLEQARALVPQVRAVLLQLAVRKRRQDEAHAALHALLDANGDPRHADEANRREQEIREIGDDIGALLEHLADMDIELRDLEMGLVDFPGERDGRPIWLCWRLSDPELAYWHGTDEGYASRKPC